MAPELHNDSKSQSPKVDIWSLIVTVASAMGFIDFGALRNALRSEITKAILNVTASNLSEFRYMAQVDVSFRATAAMMLFQMKKNHPDILAVAQDTAILPVRCEATAGYKSYEAAAPPPAVFPPPAFGVPHAVPTFDPAVFDYFGVPLAPAQFDANI
ncbi:hypothetical protein VE03_09136 [Pseudogymnoascus sp. 23342-1-I1]|nr:hypothetical protein VE03_09136 [Pseudogymnoascus sp. 23342-1-I1]